MDGESRSRRSLVLARLGFSIGALVGVIEGALALGAIGPPTPRVATMAISIAVDGIVLAAVGAGVGALVRRARIPQAAGTAANAGSLLALTVGLGIALVGAAWRGPNPPDRPNVLFISIDTLRPDHLSAYRYARETSPRLSALARAGVIFEDATAHATWTLPAHVSMLTGLDPAAHGVLARADRIQGFHDTLAERLRAEGYATGAWVGTHRWGFVGARYGFDQGFDSYVHFPHARRFRTAKLLRLADAEALERLQRGVGNARDQIDAVIDWIGIEREAPFFAFLHLYDVHSKWTLLPYEGPAPFRDMFCPGEIEDVDFCDQQACATQRLIHVTLGSRPRPSANQIELARCLYDGAIAFVDHELGRLFDALEDWGIAQHTIVIATSDHGEGFFEHASPLHFTLHQEITAIPLIIKGPGVLAGKRAKGVVRQSDLVPTVLELTGAPPASDLTGRSLVDVLKDWRAVADSETLAFDRDKGGVMLRSGSQVLIQHGEARQLTGKPTLELYDLDSDPRQRINDANRSPGKVAALRARMSELQRDALARRARLGLDAFADPVTLDDESRAALRALGYIEQQPE
ncbi:MAG: sulfatase [bacterium]|nr:sulfatase [bacterium]